MALIQALILMHKSSISAEGAWEVGSQERCDCPVSERCCPKFSRRWSCFKGQDWDFCKYPKFQGTLAMFPFSLSNSPLNTKLHVKIAIVVSW